MMNENIRKPDPTEYLPYYGKYVSLVPDGDILTILSKQIEETTNFLNSIPESRGSFRYASDKWSIKDVVGHLIDTERIFAYRALRFARNDKTPLPGYEQDDYVSNASFDRCTLADLASESGVSENHRLEFKHSMRTPGRALAWAIMGGVSALWHILLQDRTSSSWGLSSRELSALGCVETEQQRHDLLVEPRA